ncbi:MAG: hypothetical protein LC101_06450, partial [Flavobacteriales bacterium]|nr:hypothetical protein [Flavobacteriales bacterium]
MRRAIKYYRILWFKNDLPAGLSVFLVALPLCLGIALASGAPLYAGLLSGIVGGLVVSLISGSQLAVSGPAAGLTTVVAAVIVSSGDYRIFMLSVIVAGVFQLILGILKLGTIAYYFPSSVIKGMMAAIGIILISKQIPVALGYDQPDFWESGFLNLFHMKNFSGYFENFNSHTTKSTVFITLVSLLILFLWQQPFARKFKILPSALLVVIMGIIVHQILKAIDSPFFLKDTQLVNIPDNIFEDIALPDFSRMFANVEIWKSGLVIGVLASLESLLCVEAIDKLDKRNRITPVNRELVAQGIGNVVCGLVGAIPLTAVVVRGAANVDAGGRTKLAAFTHGLFLLLSVLFIPFILNSIPYASLSAILIVIGYNLTNPKLYRHIFSLGWQQFLPFLITIIAILLTDLLIGVSFGLFIS